MPEMVRFTHAMESALDRLRRRQVTFTPIMAGLLLDCHSYLVDLLQAMAEGAPPPTENRDTLLAHLAEVFGVRIEDGDEGSDPGQGPGLTHDGRITTSGGGALGADHWHLSLRFGRNVLRDGLDPLAFVNYLTQYGQILHIETIADELPPFALADPEDCHLGFEVALRSSASKEDLESVFDYVRSSSRIVILPPRSQIKDFIGLIESLQDTKTQIGEILVQCGSVTAHELEAALAAQHLNTSRPLGQILVEQGVVQPELIEAAVDKQRRSEEVRTTEAQSVKVPTKKLDTFITRVGELVIAGAGMTAEAAKSDQPGLLEFASLLVSLVEDIRDMALGMRMVAIGEVFSRFPRVARDISRELGKTIEIQISGADSELDKSMVDKIADPLMHLVRNALDHGIEPMAARLAAGKPAKGLVSLNAYHESGSIVIEVADDGAGLDRNRILAKAEERGLVEPGARLTDEDIYRLILAPGFSTATKLTNLSGRGVGMDVVQANVEALRGTLEIDTEAGQGTTMRLTLPLTLAIIDGFHVGVGTSHFIIPLDMVVECIELPAGWDADYLELRGKAVPILRLHTLFDVQGTAHARPRVVVVGSAHRQAGLVVDRIYGKCQTVIKPLGPLFREVQTVSGSTIIGSGEVGLILDIPSITQLAAQRHNRRLTTTSGHQLAASP
jgi:two-component system chemotaxis sensor kinase CheA